MHAISDVPFDRLLRAAICLDDSAWVIIIMSAVTYVFTYLTTVLLRSLLC